MTLHRFPFVERDAHGRAIRRTWRFVERKRAIAATGAEAVTTVVVPPPAAKQRVSPRETEAPLTAEEEALMKEILARLAAMEERLAAIEDRPQAPPVPAAPREDARMRADLQELAGVVQDGFKRLEAAIAAARASSSDLEPRMAKAERALSVLADGAYVAARDRPA